MDEDGEAKEDVEAGGSEMEEAASDALSHGAISALCCSGHADARPLTSTSEQVNADSVGMGWQQSVIRTGNGEEGRHAEVWGTEDERRGGRMGESERRERG